MSDDSRQALAAALATLTDAQQKADELKRVSLDQIARQLPDRVDAAARTVAKAQPEVTKSLGKEGIERLQDELARLSSVLASEVRGAIGAVKWPDKAPGYTLYDAGDSVRNFLRPRADRVASLLAKHGYDIREYGVRGQRVLEPKDLFDAALLRPLNDALVALDNAKRLANQAKKADDDSTVDDLWGARPE